MFCYFALPPQDSDDAEDCQQLADNKRISSLVSPELHQRLEAHIDWVREEMPSWLTEEHENLGLNSTFLFSALTADWDKKKPLWLRSASWRLCDDKLMLMLVLILKAVS